MTVVKDGSVEVRVPAAWSEARVAKVIDKHKLWMKRREAEFTAKRKKAEAKAKIVWCELPDTWWRKAARRDLWVRLDHWAAVMGVTVRKRRLTGARTRWGSCNSLGDISLSWRLMLVGAELRDYVVIHELAHRRHLNHSARFWAEVGKWCPDYDAKRAALRAAGGDTA